MQRMLRQEPLQGSAAVVAGTILFPCSRILQLLPGLQIVRGFKCTGPAAFQMNSAGDRAHLAAHLADLGGISRAGGVQEVVGPLGVLLCQRLLHHRPHAQQIGHRLSPMPQHLMSTPGSSIAGDTWHLILSFLK